MEVRIKDKRQNGICLVTITLVLNDTDKSRVAKFGYPSVEAGGEFTGFTLPGNVKKLSEFPISERFDGVEFGHTLAKSRADVYHAEMGIRLKNVWTEFRAIPDDFGDDKVFTV